MSDLNEMATKIIDSVEILEEDSVVKIANQALDSGMEPLHLVELIAEGMSKVGRRYEAKEYYIADLIMAGSIFKDILKLERVQEHFRNVTTKKAGKVLLGTVRGDIHDIGKYILKGMLEANSFEVIDLGVDVPSEIFVAKYLEHKPDIIGLSGILTSTIDSMKDTVDAFVEAHIRDEVKIILGGSHLNADTCAYIGADSFTNDASVGVKTCLEWMVSKNRKEVQN